MKNSLYNIKFHLTIWQRSLWYRNGVSKAGMQNHTLHVRISFIFSFPPPLSSIYEPHQSGEQTTLSLLSHFHSSLSSLWLQMYHFILQLFIFLLTLICQQTYFNSVSHSASMHSCIHAHLSALKFVHNSNYSIPLFHCIVQCHSTLHLGYTNSSQS